MLQVIPSCLSVCDECDTMRGLHLVGAFVGLHEQAARRRESARDE